MEFYLLIKCLFFSQILYLVLSSICDKHPGIHPYECCDVPPLYNEEMMSDCRVQFKDLESLKSGAVSCFVLCALSTTNASLKEPNKVEVLADIVTQKYQKTEPKFASVIQNAMFKCMNVTNNSKTTTGLATRIGNEPGKFICDPNALLIKGCIAIEIFLNCPSERLTNKTSCETLNKYLKECRH